MGFTAADYDGDEVELWPENERAINLYSRLSTQLLVGMGGAYGLNYIPMFHMMDRMNLTPTEYDWLESDMRVIEREAIAQMNKKED